MGDSNRFELQSQDGNTLITKGGWKVTKPNAEKAELMFIRPEALILYPAGDSKDIEEFEVTITTILFDGSNTKLSTVVVGSTEELLISLPQNAQFENLEEGDQIPIGIHRDDLKCY